MPTVVLRLPIESDAELAALRGALLSAKAAELAEINRRAGRLSAGYGSESARDSMGSEVDATRLRWLMLDRLVAALAEAVARE